MWILTLPLHATSSGACHFKWRVASWACRFMPLQVACRTVSMPLHAVHATSSGACHFKWRVAPWECHFMPLHATFACDFKWRVAPRACHFMPLQVAHATSSGVPLHATSSYVKWREVAKSVYAPPACSKIYLNISKVLGAVPLTGKGLQPSLKHWRYDEPMHLCQVGNSSQKLQEAKRAELAR